MKKSKIGLNQRKAFHGFLFTLPFVIGFIFFMLFPLIRSIVFSFYKLSVDNSGMIKDLVGFQNYKQALFIDPTFVKTIASNIWNMLINVVSILIFSFFISTILNQKFVGRTLSRIIFFLPVVITSGVIFLLQNDAFLTSANQAISGSGANVEGMEMLNLTGLILDLLPFNSGPFLDIITAAVNRIYDITTSSGVQIIIFLAGLQNISPAIYEASSIEGASGWENFWKITMPMISPLILVNTVYSIIDSLNGLSNPIISTIYRTAFSGADFGLSAAMSWVYVVVILVVLVVAIACINKFVFYENN